MQPLEILTNVVNLLALAVSLWLAFYIVTRSPHSLPSWLSAFALALLASFFACNALNLNGTRGLFLSWLREAVLLVLPIWLHVTYLLLPVGPHSRLPRLHAANRIAIPLFYAAALALAAAGTLPADPHVAILNLPFGGGAVGGSGPYYSVYVLVLLLGGSLSLANLWQARQRTPSPTLGRPFNSLIIASALVALAAVYAGISTLLPALNIPTLPTEILAGLGVILLGYAVARHAALLEGRPMDLDLVYSLLVVGSLTAFYVFIVLLFYWGGQVTFATVVLTIVGTIAASSLLDGTRVALDRLFYQTQFRKLRSNLRTLSREAGTAGTLANRLQALLASLCRLMRIQQGLIALRSGEEWVVQAAYNTAGVPQTLALSALASSESVGLVLPERKGLPGMTLLVPLASSGGQIGALILGAKESRQPYGEADLELLEDLADQLAHLIHAVRVQDENAKTLNRMLEAFQDREHALERKLQELLAGRELAPGPQAAEMSEENLLPQVEEALRRLHDFAYLGEQPLARLRLVEHCLEERHEGTVTFVDRGKALSQVLVEALGKLRPDGPEPGRNAIPGREWHPFIILYNSYALDEPNRDIMSRLYISEGTFNRARRRALRTLTQSLLEMEQRAAGR